MSVQKKNPLELKRRAIRELALSQRGVAFDPNTGECFSLNQSAFYIVRALQDGFSIQTIVDELQEKWEKEDPKVIEKSVETFLNQLRRYRLYI